MHGMINSALQGFVLSNYGAEAWSRIASAADLPASGFEAMERYDDTLTMNCFVAATRVLDKRADTLLEDIGTHLVTHPTLEPLRRLLRFGGGSFAEFLLSLEELPERAALAIPEVEVPTIALSDEGSGTYLLRARWTVPGIAPILMGALRAMADDYGALVLMELAGRDGLEERLRVQIFDVDFSQGRAFSLGQPVP